MLKQLILVLSIAYLTFSCTPENRLYSERQELSPNLEWIGTDVKTFKVTTSQADLNYSLNLELRYVTGYPFKNLNIIAKFIAPSGTPFQKEYTLNIKNEKGEYIGEAGMDLWDSKHLVDSQLNLNEVGEYTIEFSHNMAMDPLPYVMELGIILDKNQ